MAAPLLAEAQAQSADAGRREGPPGRRDRATRPAAGPRPRRVVFKAEILAKGPNTRFVVTTRDRRPARPLRLVRRPRRAGELDQGLQERPRTPTASATIASGPTPSACSSTPPPTGCSITLRRWLALGPGRPPPVRHPPPPRPQDRRLGPRTHRPRHPRRLRPPQLSPPRPRPLAPPRPRLTHPHLAPVNNPGLGVAGLPRRPDRSGHLLTRPRPAAPRGSRQP